MGFTAQPTEPGCRHVTGAYRGNTLLQLVLSTAIRKQPKLFHGMFVSIWCGAVR